VSRWWKRSDELESRLHAHRVKPRVEFLAAEIARIQLRRSPKYRVQVALAAALMLCSLVTFGALGGVGYASSAAKAFATSIVSSQGTTKADQPSPKGQGNNQNQQGQTQNQQGQTQNQQGQTQNQQGENDEVTSADGEYPDKTTICHRTHSSTNPWVVITVSNNALPAHAGHGDTLVGPGGSCPGPPIR
jgi:hypothetical protein